MLHPAEFYRTYWSAPEDQRAAIISTEQSNWDTMNRDLQAVGAGRSWLTSQQNDVDAAARTWADDPSRALVTQQLTERTSPGYSFFSPTERTAAELSVAQSAARAQNLNETSAAAHGTYGSGGMGQNAAAIQTLADTGGMQLRAQIDADEKKLKNQALQALASTTSQYNAADTAYVNAGNQLAGALAALESGVDFQPTDYTVWPTLAAAEDRAASEAAFNEWARAAMEEEAKFGVQDFANLFFSGLGAFG
jgi:hypothetical protein